MSRMFAFGCSFTNYWRWPTWADALGRQADLYQNWGVCGGGNCLIFNSLIECDQRNRIGPTDQVYIMWTNTSREDRYVNGRWLEGGNVYWSAGSEYPAGYVEKFADERGYLIRDCAVIAAAVRILDTWGCDWRMFSMVPLKYTNDQNDLGNNPAMQSEQVTDVIQLYAKVLDRIAPSVYETVFDNCWFNNKGIADAYNNRRRDFHPTPLEHLSYLDQVAPDLVILPQTRSWIEQCEYQARQGSLQWTQSTPGIRL